VSADLRPLSEDELNARYGPPVLVEAEPAKALIVSAPPEFSNLQKLERLDAYNLDIDGVTFRLTWSQLQSWSALRAEMRRRVPDVIITWEPDPPQKVRVTRGRDKYGAPLGEKIVNKAGEWDRIVGDLFANLVVIPQDSQADPRGQAIAVLRAALRNAPTIPAQPLLWRDQRRKRYVVSTDAAMAVLERAGIDLERNEVAAILRGCFHATSDTFHVPYPHDKTMRAYVVSARPVQRGLTET
jgi:hypothetical protein